MVNTFIQIYIHYVFAVQNRLGLIQTYWRDELYKYMTGTITHKGHRLLQNGLMTIIWLWVNFHGRKGMVRSVMVNRKFQT